MAGIVCARRFLPINMAGLAHKNYVKMHFNIGKFWKNKRQPESVRKKNSESLKLAYKTGRHKKVWKGKHFSQEHKRKLRISNIKTWSNPELRERQAEIQGRILIDWWKQHSNISKSGFMKLRKYYRNNPIAWREFLKGGKNPYRLNIRSKLGVVRSKGEKQIADYLYENKISSSYEKFTLQLESWICTPDFYLEKENMFIEYYGGYPGSYKKKVIKNKLYKKYSIPVLAIQPYELRNLSFLKNLKRSNSYSWKKFVI